MHPVSIINKETGERDAIAYQSFQEEEIRTLIKSIKQLRNESEATANLEIPKGLYYNENTIFRQEGEQPIPLYAQFYLTICDTLFNKLMADEETSDVYARRIVIQDDPNACVCVKYLNFEKQKVGYKFAANTPFKLALAAYNTDPAILSEFRGLVRAANADNEQLLKMVSEDQNGPFSFVVMNNIISSFICRLVEDDDEE